MFRISAILLFWWVSALAENQLLLNTHIRMIPKIMALDTQISTRIPSGKVTLAIVYDQNRKAFAQKFADSMMQLYHGEITSLKFNVIIVSADELNGRNDISFAYILEINPASLKLVSAWSVKNSIPTFAYNTEYLESGILGSIAIERSTVIYINKKVMKNGHYRFNDSLTQIARFIE